ncbi:MAG: hypothetical protein KGO96_12450 [Elusimicrobia bacterium]|nr:hypothetical protein [Elusimicrobiota bacterium]
MAKTKGASMGNMHAGLKRTCPPGDSGMRPPKGSVNDGATRDSVAQSHSLGGRVA